MYIAQCYHDAFIINSVALFHLGEFDAAEKVFIQGKSLDGKLVLL